MAAEPDLKRLLLELADAGIEFVVVGGLAAVLQGVPIATFDLDIVHARTTKNIAALSVLLEKLEANSRLHPEAANLRPGEAALLGPGHQLLRTRFGPLDLLGAVEGGLGYQELVSQSEDFLIQGRTIKILSLKALANLKANAVTPKDQLSRLLLLETLRVREEEAEPK